jgi:hypothetical protein
MTTTGGRESRVVFPARVYGHENCKVEDEQMTKWGYLGTAAISKKSKEEIAVDQGYDRENAVSCYSRGKV